MNNRCLNFRCIAFALMLSTHCVALCLAQDKAKWESNFDSYVKYLSPEKLYLHTDKDIYNVGDTIWFKAYLRNASDFAHYGESNYIYVELLSELPELKLQNNKYINTNRVRKRIKIKRDEGGFSGYIPIPIELNSGITFIRAYSYWMLNQTPMQLFFKNILLRNPLKDDVHAQMVENKVKDADRYKEIKMENPFSIKRRTIEDIDLQILPESGRYLAGEKSVFGLKSITEDGKGVKVFGDIYADGHYLSKFETDDYGLGRIELSIPLEAKKVYAKVSHSSVRNKEYEIQSPSGSGVVINLLVSPSGAKFSVKNKGVLQPLKVIIYDKNEVYFTVDLDRPSRKYDIKAEYLSQGVNNVAVVDDSGVVYAERSFFVFPSKNVDVKIHDVASFGKRELINVKCEINRTDGLKTGGDFSVSVSDDMFSPRAESGYDIRAYMYLGSEMDSFVEGSKRFFDDSVSIADRYRDMDLVMLTHGWKYYDLPEILKGKSVPEYGKEYTQSISGKVSKLFGFQAKHSIISVVAPKIGLSLIADLDSTGYFCLNNLNFPDGTNFILSTANKKGESRYMPVLNKDVFAARYSFPKYMEKVKYDIEYKRTAYPEYYGYNDSALVLTPSIITAAKPKRVRGLHPTQGFVFKPEQLRLGEELEPYKDYDVASYVVSTYPSLRLGYGAVANVILCRALAMGSEFSLSPRWQPVKLYIDQIVGSFVELSSYMVSDIEAIALLDSGQSNELSDSYALKQPLVLLIKTKYSSGAPANVSSTAPLGWQQKKYFYTPKYESEESKKRFEPMRTTLYWNPKIEVRNGVAEFEFYSSDHKSSYTIQIEGVSDSGEPVSVTKRIYPK